MQNFILNPIGYIHSEIKRREDAPLFYTEGAPDALLKILPGYIDGFYRIKTGDELIIITWLHQGKRDVLQVHPRGDISNPLTGVFLTRSPDRPNPIGLHRVKVLSVESGYLHIGPIEVVDETPVIDIKPVVETNDH